MKVFFTLLIASLSFSGFSHPTEKIPNARALYKFEKRELRKEALVKTFSPIPLISISAWRNHSDCKEFYNFFKSAHVLKDQNKFSTRQIIKAQKRMAHLFKDIREEIAQKKKELPSLLEEKGQKKLIKKVEAMHIDDLVDLLNRADKTIPALLGDASIPFAKYDKANLIYAIYIVDKKKSKKPVSILEASIKKEEKLLKKVGSSVEKKKKNS